ncbi:uncharacterized protein [Eurosta solidaginis]|uniref:uncharacterized protein n=1 Tax=Eurosta solidaginis TaxID=178769 RepID=UPI003530CDFD
MLRCIRFGEVLLDETFRTFLICNQCRTEFVEIPEFRVHLATSSCGQRLFNDDVVALKFGAAQVTRAGKDKTYLLYNPVDVQIATTEPVTTTNTDGGDDAYLDLMKIEEELLDPRWYTDIGNAEVESPQQTSSIQTSVHNNKTLEYKELVEAVGPYVQFKESVPKAKQNIVRRLSNKVNRPAVAVPTTTVAHPPPHSTGAMTKTSVLPAKRDTSTDKSSTRLLNPAVKRKLDLSPKQVHFKDKVSVKYLINEDCTNAVYNKRTRSLGNENNEKASMGDSSILKRRKTITIPTDAVNIQPDFQGQFVRATSELRKAPVEKVGTNAAAVTKRAITEANSKSAKTNSLLSSAGNCNTKPVSNNATVLKPASQANPKILVPNTKITQKQINGTKSQNNNNASLLVKNPITSSRANMNCTKSEIPLQSMKPTSTAMKAPTLVKQTIAPTMTRPQQRSITTATKPPIVQTSFAASTQKIPHALAPLCSNIVSNPAALVASGSAPKDVQQQTNDILNKLQTRGLQVKRTQPPMPPPTKLVIAAGQQHNKTMELLQKLQSKGMKVKILNGKETTQPTGATTTHTHVSINLPITGVNTKIMSNVDNVRNGAIAPGTQNQTILNNKLIIKKVQ